MKDLDEGRCQTILQDLFLYPECTGLELYHCGNSDRNNRRQGNRHVDA